MTTKVGPRAVKVKPQDFCHLVSNWRNMSNFNHLKLWVHLAWYLRLSWTTVKPLLLMLSIQWQQFCIDTRMCIIISESGIHLGRCKMTTNESLPIDGGHIATRGWAGGHIAATGWAEIPEYHLYLGLLHLIIKVVQGHTRSHEIYIIYSHWYRHTIYICAAFILENTTRSTNVVLMLDQRRRRWTKI